MEGVFKGWKQYTGSEQRRHTHFVFDSFCACRSTGASTPPSALLQYWRHPIYSRLCDNIARPHLYPLQDAQHATKYQASRSFVLPYSRILHAAHLLYRARLTPPTTATWQEHHNIYSVPHFGHTALLCLPMDVSGVEGYRWHGRWKAARELAIISSPSHNPIHATESERLLLYLSLNTTRHCTLGARLAASRFTCG